LGALLHSVHKRGWRAMWERRKTLSGWLDCREREINSNLSVGLVGLPEQFLALSQLDLL
jgi:hypothetical protein